MYHKSAGLEAPFVYTGWSVWASKNVDRGIVYRLNVKEEQRLLWQEHDQFRVTKAVLETRYTVLVVYRRCTSDIIYDTNCRTTIVILILEDSTHSSI